MKNRAASLLVMTVIAILPLIQRADLTVGAQAVRSLPTRISAAKTPADITIKLGSNRIVSSADFNGDRADDFLVQYNTAASGSASSVFDKFGIVFGKKNQDHPLEIDLGTDSPDLSLTTSVKGDAGFSAIANLGDLNGDGIDDLALTQRIWNEARTRVDLVLKVFFGSSDLSPGTLDLEALHPDLRINVTRPLDVIVDVVGSADANADGVKDLILIENSNIFFSSAIPILLGPFAPGESIDLSSRHPDVIIRSEPNNVGLNLDNLHLADVNGDRATDILIRREKRNRAVPPVQEVAVIFGSRDMTSGAEMVLDDSQPDALLNVGFVFNTTTGDVNGDGADDLLMGNPGPVLEPGPILWSEGHLKVMFGSRSLRGTINRIDAGIAGITLPSGLKPVPGELLGDRLGAAAAVNDIDGDGAADIIVGAPGLISRQTGNLEAFSRVHVILGSTWGSTGTLVDTDLEQQDISINFGPESEFLGLGRRVGSGDFNGDGFGDILVGNGEIVNVFFGGPLRPPQISRAKYRTTNNELVITGTDLTGAARVEINGAIVDRPLMFEPAEGRLFVRGQKSELNLRDGKNRVVVIRKGARSNAIKVKL